MAIYIERMVGIFRSGYHIHEIKTTDRSEYDKCVMVEVDYESKVEKPLGGLNCQNGKGAKI